MLHFTLKGKMHGLSGVKVRETESAVVISKGTTLKFFQSYSTL